MERTNRGEGFSYTYSAKEQEELRRIRQKYMPREADKLEQLRRLDKGVNRKAAAISLAAGIAGSLILGVGMCCCMIWADRWFIPGIAIGLAGIAAAAAAYPLYLRVAKKEREKIAPEILRLTDELMK